MQLVRNSFRFLSIVLYISEALDSKQAQHRACSQAGLNDSLESSVFMFRGCVSMVAPLSCAAVVGTVA